jgi:tetratricopeptide (TPR) repeat protein
VRRSPNLADAHISLARAYALIYEATADPRRDMALPERAIYHARKGCDLAPESGDAWSTLAFALGLRGDGEDAAAAAIRAAALEPEDVRDALQLAHASWGDARLRAARRVLTLRPGLGLAHWLRATVFIARGALDPAIEELLPRCAAQDAQPKGAGLPAIGLHLLLALVHAAHDRLDEAVAEFVRELSAAVDSTQLYARECEANTWYALGVVRLRQMKRDEAESALRRCLTIAPCHVSANAVLYGQIPSSASAFDRALGQALILAGGNRHADASRVYREALAKAPTGHAGWMLPVEPMLHPLARPGVWADALALVRVRAT